MRGDESDGIFGLSFDVSDESQSSYLERYIVQSRGQYDDLVPATLDVSRVLPGSIINIIPLRADEQPDLYGFTYLVDRQGNNTSELRIEAHRVVAYGIRVSAVAEDGRVFTEAIALTFDGDAGIASISDDDNFVDFAEGKEPPIYIIELAERRATSRGEISIAVSH